MAETPSAPDAIFDRREELQLQIHQRLVERLSRQARRYRELVEQVRDVLFRCDESLRLTFVNPAWTRLLGVTQEQTLGRRLKDFVLEQDRGLLSRLVDQDPGDAALATRELRLVTSTGALVFAEISLRTNGPEGMIGSLHDVTHRRIAEEELRRAKDAAEAGSLAKSQFLANMSHEIRTPMSAVLGFARCLEEPGINDDERRDFVERIVRNGEHLLSLINDILDLSQIEHGRISVVLGPCSVREVIDDVCATVSSTCARKGVSLLAHCDDSVPALVEIDSTRLRQVLTNLVGNAAKFTEHGVIKVNAEHRYSASGPRLRITVVDTGLGIRSEHLEHIFAPFTQADASTVRIFGGTGLGLAISRGLAQRLGGDIEVESQLGRGSRFTLEVYAAAAVLETVQEKALPVHSVPSIPGENRMPRVLLAEDSLDLRLWTTRKLRQQGVAVVTVEDGLEACVAVARAERKGEPFDVVLMDMQMPNCDGYEATRRLRTAGFRGRVVALTAHAMKGDRSACIEVGCDGYLSKPVTGEQLLAAVRDAPASEWTAA